MKVSPTELLAADNATVDWEILPRYPARVWAGKKSNRVRNILRLAEPLERRHADKLRSRTRVRVK
jgi:hypothetical protein